MLLSNLTGLQFGGAGGGGFAPVMPLYGNPGDYAWGRGGLDAVVTNLLNQVKSSCSGDCVKYHAQLKAGKLLIQI